MKTADEILKKYEDENEVHFHKCDRDFIIKAMDDYSDQNCQCIIDKVNKPKHPKIFSHNQFEVDVFTIINAYCKAGLQKTDLVRKIKFITGSCERS